MIITPEVLHIKRQLEVMRLRQHALRVALQLFEAATSNDELAEISSWFEQSNVATEVKVVQQALDKLLTLAHQKSLPTDL